MTAVETSSSRGGGRLEGEGSHGPWEVPGRIQAPPKNLLGVRWGSAVEHPPCSPLPPPRRPPSPAARCSRRRSTDQRVDALPVAPDSAAIVRSIGLDGALKADFGSGLWEGGPIGIPYDVVARRTTRSRVRFDYAGESDRVRYPIPRGVHVEGGADADGDRHALLLDRSRCRLYELFALRREGDAWHAGSGATWNLRRPRLRPSGWTSADAAGLPILPLLARYPEVRRGRIRHALRMTVSQSRRAFAWPARHFASDDARPGAAADGRAAAAAAPRSTSPACRARRAWSRAP